MCSCCTTTLPGGVVSPANPNYTSGEIAHQLRETQAKVMVVHPSALKSAVAAAKEVGTVKHIFVFGDHAVGGIQPYTQALLGNRLAEPVSRKADDLAYLCFSSGTTGKERHIYVQCKHNVLNHS